MCSAGAEENPPDLTGFKVDRTYIVTYGADGKEYTKQPISDILEEGYTVDSNNALVQGEIDFGKIDTTNGEWYDYSKQKWANIVTRNNGVEAYYVWIPRYAYALNNNETTDVIFIDTFNVNRKTGKKPDLTKYTIPEAFTWMDKPLSGYWIGKYQINDGTAVVINATITTGVNNITLSLPDTSTFGKNLHYDIALKQAGKEIYRIDNTKDTSFEFSEDTIETYLFGGTYEITIAIFDEQGYYIGDTVKTCTLQGAKITAHIFEGANKIRITEITNDALTDDYKYDVILNKNGQEINKVENLNTNECEFTKDITGNRLEAGDYVIQIILKNQNGDYRGETSINAVCYSQPEIDRAPNEPDILGFRADTTYIVTYDESGNEDTSQTLASVLGTDGQVDLSKVQGVWYDYANQKWANVVTRNNGVEAYFVWIPRYEYHAYSYEQITDVYFIGTEQETPTNGYIIPEAFTWNGTQISGYWIGKYQISDN